MTAATYTSDLADIYLFESTGSISAYGGGASGLGASPDYAIEGTNAVDKQVSAAEKGFMYDNTTNFTIGADDHFFIWLIVGVPGLADTRDNRGIHVSIGDDTSNFVKFHANGNDTLPLGGLVPYPIRFVNTTLTNFRTLVGSPGTTPSWIGGGANITGTAKFSNFAADAARIGTGYDILNGTGADPEADFAGIASDDASTAEGVLLVVGGGYNLQGKLRIGSSTTACEFLDSNTNINIVDSIHSLTDFTEILLEHASSILTLTNVNFNTLGTNNLGRFEMITSTATANLTNVGFIGFGVTVLGTGATLAGCRWVGSGIVTANGADLTGSTVSGFEGTVNTSPLIWDVATNPNGLLDDMTFTKGTAATHAIEFGTTSPLTMTLTGINFSGYNAANGNNDSAIHIKRTSGTVNVTVSGGSGTVSYRTDGATVNIISGAVTVQATAALKDGTAVENARVFLKASDGTGPFPFQDAITSITRSTTTATVTTTAVHGMETNDKIFLEGITDKVEDNYTVKTITVTGTSTFTYTTTDSGSTAYTGTKTCTFVALNGLTNASGILSTSRVYSSNQPVTGWTRKSTSSPLLQEGVLVGEVDSSTGFAGTAVMLADE